MKRTLKSFLATVAIMCVYSCGTVEVAPTESLKEIGGQFNNVSVDFSIELWKQMDVAEKNKNYFVSPLSLHTALGMLLNGSGGRTTEEMKQTLKISGLSDQQVNDTYAKIMATMPKVDPKVTTNLANSIWAKQGVPFSKTFLDQNKTTFAADVYQEPFDGNTLTKLNKWAADKTNNKIKKVLDDIDPNAVMFLMNALYFKGDWAIPFDSKQTEDEDFKGRNLTKKIKMMNLTESFGYSQNDKFSALELPYGSGKYNMTIVLPNEGQTVEGVLSGFTVNEWRDLQNLTKRKVELKLPKFTLEYEIKLNDILKNMGMKQAFDAGDWTRMSDDAATASRLKLSFVKQNTFIAVDEKGTEAAAVTTIGVELTSAGPANPVFYCNKPFMFIIHEKTSGQVMFIGKIVNL